MMTKQMSRIVLIVLGVGLGLLSLVAPGLKVEGVEARSVGQILLLSLSLLLIIIGLVGSERIGARSNKIYRISALLLLNTILMFLFIEAVAVLGWNVFIRRVPQDQLIPQPENMAYYRSVPWGEKHWNELYQISNEVYQPFTIWTRAPFAGETLNIDEKGIRQTAGADCTDDAYTVFMFGGSTMWGLGAPDDMTIAAYVQEGLSQTRSTPVCVVNMGEIAYVSTQEMIRLIKELQLGHIPDQVIFYDGLNDVAAAWQSDAAATHQNLAPIADRFQSLTPHPLIQWMRESYTMRLLGVFVGAQGYRIPRDRPVEALASDVVSVYNVNRRIIAGLAEDYGFDYLFVWQPTITATGKALTPEEQKIVQALDPRLRELGDTVYAKMEGTDDPHFYSVVHALDSYTDQLWFDTSHIVPPGNQLIAADILDRLNNQE